MTLPHGSVPARPDPPSGRAFTFSQSAAWFSAANGTPFRVFEWRWGHATKPSDSGKYQPVVRLAGASLGKPVQQGNAGEARRRRDPVHGRRCRRRLLPRRGRPAQSDHDVARGWRAHSRIPWLRRDCRRAFDYRRTAALGVGGRGAQLGAELSQPFRVRGFRQGRTPKSTNRWWHCWPRVCAKPMP